MDFSQLIDMINAYIPNEIAGIDSIYVIGGVAVVLLLLWFFLRSTRSEPKRELVDLVPEQVEQEESHSDEEETQTDTEERAELEGSETSEVLSDTQADIETEQTDEEDETLPEEELQNKAEAVEETSVEQEAQVQPQQGVLSRKKRESTRNGRKIVKADFSDFSGQRILIAEDNLINQKVINGVLNESGIDVVIADDGQIVMDILEKDSNFEIILMDAHMPRVDGFEATRMIRENPAYDHIAVVALSGDTAADDIRHMREAGMEETLEKPLKMDALYDVMSMYYTMPQAQEEIEKPNVEELEIDVDINDLPSLDYALGLEICGNDEAMYKELLKEFFVGYKDSSKNLRDALVKKDYAAAKAILIDVKGTASNLGAKQFLQLTDHFLKELSEGNTAAYGGLFKDYQSFLLNLLKSIQNAFKS